MYTATKTNRTVPASAPITNTGFPQITRVCARCSQAFCPNSLSDVLCDGCSEEREVLCPAE